MAGSAEDGPPKLWERPLLLFLLLAVLVRILNATASPILNTDGYFYIEAARHYQSGDWGAALRSSSLHPLYPVAIALFRFVIPSGWIAGMAVSILCAAGALVALYGIVLGGWGRWPARFTALVYALHPIYATMEGRVLTQGMFHLLAFWAVFFLWRGIRSGSWRCGIFAGLCLGGAYAWASRSFSVFSAPIAAGGSAWRARDWSLRWGPRRISSG
ncbi:MAG: ArnT family glycosyltransferase [Planctomycetota bacterium]|jgi:4-amino-4-deoxy-L-arabinose transferase-like glycosyltransferase